MASDRVEELLKLQTVRDPKTGELRQRPKWPEMRTETRGATFLSFGTKKKAAKTEGEKTELAKTEEG